LSNQIITKIKKKKILSLVNYKYLKLQINMQHLRGNAIPAGYVQNPYSVVEGFHGPFSLAKFQHYMV